MRAAFFLSFDASLQRHLEDLLRPRGALVNGEFVQLQGPEDGDHGWFTWFGRIPESRASDFRDPPWDPADGVALPDMSAVDGYYVECRFEQQVAEIAKELAEASGQPLWVQDGNGVIWDARAVDPRRLVL